MGWNAGGYGVIRFASKAALSAWRADTVAHSDWDDWIGELRSSIDPDEKVSQRLAAIAKQHDPKNYPMMEIQIDALDVRLTYDDGEDGFRDGSGDVAAVLRVAERHGAKGVLFFLGTAGAERDFAYELSFDGKASKLAALKRKAIARAYGDDYQAFMDRLGAMQEAADPSIADIMKEFREGEKPRTAGASLHARVLAALRDVSNAELKKLAQKFPSLVPDGMGAQQPAQLFAKGDVRSFITNAKSEEMRAVALWVLGKDSPAIAIPFALEVLDAKDSSEPMRCAAIRVLGHATGDAFDDAFDRVAQVFRAPESIYHIAAGQGAILAFRHPDLVDRIAELLPKVANVKTNLFGVDPAVFLLKAIERRKLGKPLAAALARFVKKERRGYVTKLAETIAKKARMKKRG